jgi:UPF0755 protein
VAAAVAGYEFYRRIYLPNITLKQSQEEFIYIPTGSDFTDVRNILVSMKLLKDPASFEWVAKRMKYTLQVKPGKYRILRTMSNRELVTMLRSGKQVPVRLVFHNIRTRKQLAGVVGNQLEADSTDLLSLFTDDVYLSKYGINSETCLTLFIPNTYEFYWNTDARKFVERMATEYSRFWNRSRNEKAQSI